MNASVTEQRAWEETLIPDKFKHETGPFQIDKRWLEELNRIDNRLVLRWQPYWRVYAVFSRFSEDRLWGQPTHIIEDPATGRFRRPDERDLKAIRYACHVALTDGSAAWERMLDDQVKAQADQSSAAIQHIARTKSAALCKKYDLTRRKLMEMCPFA